MKNVKKVLILALAVLVLANAFAACNGSNSKSTGSSATSTSTETSTSSAPPEEVYPDFQGKTVTVACWVDITPELGKSQEGDAQYYANEWVKEKYNCNIEYIALPESEYFATFASNTAAGIKFADIVTAHCWYYIGEINKGYYEPVTEWMSKADPERWDNNVSSYKNEIWGVKAMPPHIRPSNFLIYNTELLAELNLESPQKLAREGKWNWDTFRSYCKAAVADTNGDSEIDRWGISPFMLPDVLKYSDNIEAYTYVDGVYKNAYTYPGTRDKMLGLLSLMAEMRLEDKSIMGDVTGGMPARDEMQEAFRNGSLLFCVYGWDGTAAFKKEGVKNYAPVTLPLGPHTEKLDDHVTLFSYYAIPKFKDFETEDLVRLWMDRQTIWDPSRGQAYYEMSAESIIEDEQAQYFLTREDAQFMFDMSKGMGRVGSYVSSLGIGGIEIWDIYAPVLRGEKTPVSVMEATDNQIQAKLDEILNSISK